jgi:hypothetical protein
MIETLTAEDRAFSLRTAARRVETSLLALETFDARYAGSVLSAPLQSDRRLLVDVAAQFLWEYIVQREMSGITDHREARERYAIPDEVWLRMGASPRPA